MSALPVAAAEELTGRIRSMLTSMLDLRDEVADLILEAKRSSAHETLGYPSWTAYVSAEFADALPRLTPEDRREFVAELAASGMSTRAIAPVVGVDHATVVRDQARGASAPPERPLAPVVGLDGKAYQRPAPINHKAMAEASVERYPDLAFQYECGDYEHCWRMAEKLDEFAERGQLEMRLANLRRSNEIDRSKRDGTYEAPVLPPTCPTCGQLRK